MQAKFANQKLLTSSKVLQMSKFHGRSTEKKPKKQEKNCDAKSWHQQQNNLKLQMDMIRIRKSQTRLKKIGWVLLNYEKTFFVKLTFF